MAIFDKCMGMIIKENKRNKPAHKRNMGISYIQNSKSSMKTAKAKIAYSRLVAPKRIPPDKFNIPDV